jgi:arabinofuranosyltransferase
MKAGYFSFFVFILIIFSLGCYYHYPFLSDDSLISLRYAQRFIEGKGLTWNDGQPVEGYSNLLWILLISLLGKMGINLILAARIWGILCSVGTLAVVLSYFKTKNTKKEYVFSAVFLLVTTPCFTVWAIGGLEQPLYIFLLTLALTEVSKIINGKNSGRMYLLSLWLGLLAITRPDGFLFTIITAAFLCFFFRKCRRDLIKVFFIVALVPALFLLGQLVFRYGFYGELVPNTALVKVKVTVHHVLRGGFYMVKAFTGTLLLSALGLYGLFHLVYRKKNPFGIYLLLNAVAWTAYVVLVGGDIFPAFRHYYVVLIVLVFALIFSLGDLNVDFKTKGFRIGLMILLIINAYIQLFIPANEYAIGERWEFRGLKLGKTLKKSFPETTVIAVTAAGSIPYASGLPAIDMLGLNDYYTPRHPPGNFGTGALAHELGDARYVLGRNPDLIIYHMGVEPQFNIGEQMKINPVFENNYVKVFTRQSNDAHILYFNKYGKNTGIQKKGNLLIIPGYLLNTDAEDESIFNGNGKLLKHLQKGKRYTLSLRNPDSEKWEVSKSSEILFPAGLKIRYGKNRMIIEIRPEKELFLETLELHRKYE